jgi:integrase
MVNDFRDALLATGLSRATARKILVSFKSVLKDARRRGTLASNPAEGVSITVDGRAKRKLEVGRDIPTRAEISAIIAAATGPARPFLMTAIFTGLRASELRGLSWRDVDFGAGLVHVRQRADRFNKLGAPKSASSARTVPLPPVVTNTLREWRLQCPKASDLVFGTASGKPQGHGKIFMGWLRPTLAAAGISKPYGLHCFRHFFCSWCINRPEEGGRGLSLKQAQTLMGHATLAMTSDTYGHLMPQDDDGDELARAAEALVSVPTSR